MDWLTFASKVIEAIAWPLTILVLVFKFSDRFRELLGKLTELNLPGGISGKFEAPLKNAENLAKQLELTFSGEKGIEFTPDPIALSANPTGVIMEAWKELNSVGADLIQMSDVSRSDKMFAAISGNREILGLITAEKLIPDDEMSLLKELQRIRNRAAHSVSDRPTPEDAERFVAIVRALETTWIGRMASAQPR